MQTAINVNPSQISLNADDIRIKDAGGIITANDVEGALQENRLKLNAHIAGTADKHAADKINYSGNVTGVSDVKAAIDRLQTNINNISMTGSQHDALVTAALIDVENENFNTAEKGYLNGRLEKWEQRTKAIENDIQEGKTAELIIDGGIGTLPDTAVKGQVSVTVKGRSLKNELDYDIDTYSGWRGSSTAIIDSNGITLSRYPSYAEIDTKIKPSTRYGILGFISHNTLTHNLKALSYVTSATIAPAGHLGNFKSSFNTKAEISNNIFGIITSSSEVSEGASVNVRELRIFELPPGSEIEADFETLTADELAQKYPYISGDSVKSTISAMRIRSVSSDETQQSEIYVPNIGELRSLPNGVKDEINLTQGKATIRTGKLIIGNIGFGNADSYDDNYYRALKAGILQGLNMVYQTDNSGIGYCTDGNFRIFSNASPSGSKIERGMALYTDGRLYVFVEKSKIDAMSGTTLGDKFNSYFAQYPVTLIYQLAQPIETNVPAQMLTGGPNHTIMWLPHKKDKGLYTETGFIISDQSLPIKSLISVKKKDLATGQDVDIDLSTCTVAGDGLSFTSSALVEGDSTVCVYEYDDSLGTKPQIVVKYNNNFKAQVNSNTDAIQRNNKAILNMQDRLDLMYADLDFRLTILELSGGGEE